MSGAVAACSLKCRPTCMVGPLFLRRVVERCDVSGTQAGFIYSFILLLFFVRKLLLTIDVHSLYVSSSCCYQMTVIFSYIEKGEDYRKVTHLVSSLMKNWE